VDHPTRLDRAAPKTIQRQHADQPTVLIIQKIVVRLARARRHHVLTVPVTALIATKGGGYAVEVARAGGGTQLVAVSPGLYAGGYVEIDPLRRGSLHAGDRVTVPS
jgi:multidrug efflux pump subunit AcrA (membrane-fusion protein)